MITDPWFYVSNDVLIKIYRKAVEQKFDNNFIQMAFKKIKKRNLRIDKPSSLKLNYLERIK